jgi:hypothetical protein
VCLGGGFLRRNLFAHPGGEGLDLGFDDSQGARPLESSSSISGQHGGSSTLRSPSDLPTRQMGASAKPLLTSPAEARAIVSMRGRRNRGDCIAILV